MYLQNKCMERADLNRLRSSVFGTVSSKLKHKGRILQTKQLQKNKNKINEMKSVATTFNQNTRKNSTSVALKNI